MSHDAQDEALLAAARAARQRAFAPYSGFLVGAAVRAADGRVFTGCNVEVASYSLTCCAERVAVFKAVSEGATDLVACAVVADMSPPASPCGACRQVLHDFGAGMSLLLENVQGELRRLPLKVLLPDAFEPAQVLQAVKAHHGA